MQPRPFLSLLAAGIAALALLPAVAQAAPPPNDSFANRIVLTGQAVSSGPITIDEATREGLEPADTHEKTLWWTWTAPRDGIVTINTQGTNRSNYLRVFNGNDLANLALIKRDEGNVARVTFPVKTGLVYQISIGFYYSDDKGTATLNLQNGPTNITAPVVVGVPAKINDNFANAVALSGPVVSGFTYNTGATREGQEPTLTREQTVWWTWTAPADAQVTMTTAGTNFTAYLSVFNGDRLSEVRAVAYNAGNVASVSFPAKAGFVYRIAVGNSYNDDVGGVPVLNITTAPLSITSPVIIGSQANANDNYSNAQSLGSNQTVSGFGFNRDATVESLEPRNNGNHTLWWTWTAPVGGTLGLDVRGTDVFPAVNVYVGDSIASAADVSANFKANGNNAVSGVVQGGTTYHFSMGSSDTGTLVLNLNLAPSGTAITIAPDGTGEAFEGGAKGAFIVTRLGSLAGPVTVAYKVGGTATGGVEYKTLPGLITIPAGAGSAKVKVKPVDDRDKHGTTTVKVTLLPGDGYGVGTPAVAKVKIRDND